MRYITFPEPLPIPGSKDKKNEKGEQKPKLFGLNDVLSECWASGQWRDSDSNIQAFARVYAAFEDKGPGDEVALENKDYEVFAPIATMKGKTIPNQLIAPLFNKMCIAVLTAPTEPKNKNGAAKALPEGDENPKELPPAAEEAAAEE